MREAAEINRTKAQELAAVRTKLADATKAHGELLKKEREVAERALLLEVEVEKRGRGGSTPRTRQGPEARR